MVKGRPTASKNKEGGTTVVWDRYGDDCAFIIRNLSVEDGFKSWDAFQKDSAFAGFLKRYARDNLKRNFDKTVKRYNEWKEDGGGGFKNKMICLFYLMCSI
jgi:hypothetical protein